MPRKPIAAEERFWPKVRKTEGCWEWTACTARFGYGWFWSGKKGDTVAHRFSYALANGPIPEGMHVLHRCDNPKCVRPDHLFLGTPAINIRDAMAKGRFGSHLPALHLSMRRTVCKHGHEYSPENTLIVSGVRRCRACNGERCSRYRQRRKARAA